METESNRQVWRVGDLTRRIKQQLEGAWRGIWVEGELSNVHFHGSGHIYFSLLDEHAQLSAACFRGNRPGLAIQPENGLRVRVFGDISVYPPRGQYQLLVRKLEPAGQGSLQEALEKLKKRLAAEGLFDPARKQPLPLLPRCIGIVTSPTGAAIRDILKVLTRRFPNVHLLLAPARVQGGGAAEQIAAGIRLLDADGGPDVLIVGRGGGSTEDLWCFNEESVVRAIADCRIPVISAVGHEIDFTLSDLVADVRAATPSAAAELVVARRDDFLGQIQALNERALNAIENVRLRLRNRVQRAVGHYVFREPAHAVIRYRQHIEGFSLRIRHCATTWMGHQQQQLDEWGVGMLHAIHNQHRADAGRLDTLSARLHALNPMAVLERGYSVTLAADGCVLHGHDEVKSGDPLTTRLARGTIESTVEKTYDDKK